MREYLERYTDSKEDPGVEHRTILLLSKYISICRCCFLEGDISAIVQEFVVLSKMRVSSLLPELACASSYIFQAVSGSAVFAHYMASTTSTL
jgi:hypothetical protein